MMVEHLFNWVRGFARQLPDEDSVVCFRDYHLRKLLETRACRLLETNFSPARWPMVFAVSQATTSTQINCSFVKLCLSKGIWLTTNFESGVRDSAS